MKRWMSAGLVLGGMVLGCGAAAVAPVAKSWAGTPAGQWSCYVVDRFPDVDAARSWDKATEIASGLNQVAQHVAAGTLVAISPGEHYPSVACVKH